MRSLFLALLLAAPLTATDLYPPASAILPGDQVTESAPIERADGTRGLMALGDNGLVISWVIEDAWSVKVVTEPTYWDELHLYGAYCRHRAWIEDDIERAETECVTLYRGRLVLQTVAWEGDGWWRVVEMEDFGVVELGGPG